jgi:hypothetical protein
LSGALDVLLDSANSGGGGSIGPTSWANIFSLGFGFNPAVTLSTISGAPALSATVTGTPGGLYTDHNGVVAPYAGPLTCHNGDTLSWGVQNTGTAAISGSVTVENSGAVVGSFTYLVKAPS